MWGKGKHCCSKIKFANRFFKHIQQKFLQGHWVLKQMSPYDQEWQCTDTTQVKIFARQLISPDFRDQDSIISSFRQYVAVKDQCSLQGLPQHCFQAIQLTQQNNNFYDKQNHSIVNLFKCYGFARSSILLIGSILERYYSILPFGCPLKHRNKGCFSLLATDKQNSHGSIATFKKSDKNNVCSACFILASIQTAVPSMLINILC